MWRRVVGWVLSDVSAYHLASSFKRQTVQEERFKLDVVLPFQTSRMNNPDTQRSIQARRTSSTWTACESLSYNTECKLIFFANKSSLKACFFRVIRESIYRRSNRLLSCLTITTMQRRCQILSLWRLERCRWSRGIAPSIFILGPKRSFTPNDRTPGDNWIAGWLFSRVTLDYLEKKQTYFFLPGIETRNVQSVA